LGELKFLLEAEYAPSVESYFKEEFGWISHGFGETGSHDLNSVANLGEFHLLVLGLGFVVSGLCSGSGVADDEGEEIL
jgi:hypothetical protein